MSAVRRPFSEHPPRTGAARLSTALLALLGCAAPAPVASPPPPPVAAGVPGCPGDLGGTWVLESDPSWRYRGVDDGGTLVLMVSRRWPDGGTPAGGGSAQVVLRRTPGAFTGETRAPRTEPGGPTCEAALPVEVAGCPDGGLALRTVDRLRVDARCLPVDAAPGERRTHLLVRAPEPATLPGASSVPDAGVVLDAGPADGGP